MIPAGFDAIVLAGGRAVRLGGIDKTAEPVGGRPLLHRVLHALDGAGQILVVGGAPPARTRVRVVAESPPARGPVHALAAALPGVTSPRVALLAGDLPFLTATALDALSDELDKGLDDDGPPADAALALDDRGRDQYLLAVWDTTALRAVLAGLPATVDQPLRALYGQARIRRLSLAGFPPPWWDCDTADDLAAARAWTNRG